MTPGYSLVVAGAQKSASTSLAELLGRHPRVSMVRREVMALEDPYYPQGIGWLKQHISESHSAGLVPALKRPELLHRAETPERLVELLPNPYVVVILRDPLARTVSAYYHYVRHGLLPALDANLGIPALLDDLDRLSPPAPGHQVVKYSLYAGAVVRMLDVLGDRAGVFYQEELVGDTTSCADQMLRAVGLEPCQLGPLPKVNTGTYHLRRFRPASVGGRLGYEINERDGSFVLTRRRARLRIAQALFALDRAWYGKAGRQPTLHPDTRYRLAAALAPDARRLPEILGRPLPSAWAASLGQPRDRS